MVGGALKAQCGHTRLINELVWARILSILVSFVKYMLEIMSG
jgi:hypothetical protein